MHPTRRFLFTVRGLMAMVFASGCVLAAVLFMTQLVANRRISCGRPCGSRIREVALALNQYLVDYGSFPPAYVADRQGRPLYSWRVLILPYVDQRDIYNAFNLSQPWNGPDNLWLSRINITVFRCPEASGYLTSPYAINFVAITGPGTAFPSDGSTTSAPQFRDGPASTILLAEVASSGIHWAEPRDLDVAKMSFVVNDASKPSICSADSQGPAIVMADGTVRRLGPSASAKIIKSLITINGGETISPGEWDR